MQNPPSSSSSSSSSSVIISEDFNEFDEEGNILRTILGFRIFDNNGKIISFDEIGEGKSKVRLEGILLEPLQNKWKDKLLDILCSRPPPDQQSTTSNSTSNSITTLQTVSSAQRLIPIPITDWDSLSIGDLVDAYCTRTLKWFEAKILEIDRTISSDNPTGNSKSFKIHFKKWNSKYDEWIPRGSPRLNLHGAITDKKDLPYSSYTAWYENSIAYQKVDIL